MEVHRPARRHGVHDDDIRHATDHPLVVVGLDPDADPSQQLAIGPDRAGNMLEVIVLTLTDARRLAIHAIRFATRTTTCSRAEKILIAEKSKPFKTKTGKVLTDADIEAMADEAERGCDVEMLKSRRRGAPDAGHCARRGCARWARSRSQTCGRGTSRSRAHDHGRDHPGGPAPVP